MTRIPTCVLLASLVLATACSTIETRHRDWSGYAGPGAAYFRLEDPPIIEVLDDDLEPLNRSMWGFNLWAVDAVVQPLASGWRAITSRSVREHVEKFGVNLAWPVRLVSNLGQGEWGNAGTETGRFLINVTVGLLGFFDPAHDWGLEAPDKEDTGQMMGDWGWDGSSYVMLPALGPSSDRDVVGEVGDAALNPATYLFPLSPFLAFNAGSDRVEPFLRFTRLGPDPYEALRYVWSLYRSEQVVDFSYKPAPDSAEVETLDAIFLSNRDPEFPARGETRQVVVPATGRELPYQLWLQPEPAPIAFVLPGLGGHREGAAAMGLAEMCFEQGFSAVTVSNAMTLEFSRLASSLAMAGYAPVDAEDTYEVLAAIDHDLRMEFPSRLTERVLLGISLGAFHTLYIAAEHGRDFDAFLAINPPVRLRVGMERLDKLFRAPMRWPEAEREEKIRNVLLKVLHLAQGELEPTHELPISRIEAEYLIGLSFRTILAAQLFDTQLRHNRGVLLTELDPDDRGPAYREIREYSYMEYLYAFVAPYLLEKDPSLGTMDEVFDRCDLAGHADSLVANDNVVIFTNRNDFLLEAQDIDWLQTTFGAERVQFFKSGGHLGNLYKPEVQQVLMAAVKERLQD